MYFICSNLYFICRLFMRYFDLYSFCDYVRSKRTGVRFPASPLEFSEIGYLLLPSGDMAEIPLNRRKSSKNQKKKPICDYEILFVSFFISGSLL